MKLYISPVYIEGTQNGDSGLQIGAYACSIYSTPQCARVVFSVYHRPQNQEQISRQLPTASELDPPSMDLGKA